MTTVRVPPGRAGRLRLLRRLEAAERGSDLLERKLHALLEEQRARQVAAAASTSAWEESAREAERWLDRALAAESRQDLLRYVPSRGVGVELGERDTMGVRLPTEVAYQQPAEDPSHIDPDSSAFICAQKAAAQAVRAAAHAAVDQAAARTVESAVKAARRQVRTLQRHWLPALRDALSRLEFVLEQNDFEDGVRRRHAHGVTDRTASSGLASMTEATDPERRWTP